MNDSGGDPGPFPRPPALDLTARVEGADPIDIEVKLAVFLGSDGVKSLVRRHAARAAELGAALDRAERTIERLHRERDQVGRERDQLAEERQRLIEERRRLIEERDRYVAELRAIRRARGELPRTGNDLRKWREERGLTQVEAAQRLAVGRATLERAEVKDAADKPLRRILRTALEQDAAATREPKAAPIARSSSIGAVSKKALARRGS